MPAADLSPNLFTYSALIDGLFKNGHVEEAIALLQSLERDKKELNIEVYSAVIDGLCRVGRLEARKKLDQLAEKDLVPDVVTFNILINGICKKEMIMETDMLLVQMENFAALLLSFVGKILISESCVKLSAYSARSFALANKVNDSILSLPRHLTSLTDSTS
ncbi:hypothetical protein WN943_028996 [Citrus x changshan-huyou]